MLPERVLLSLRGGSRQSGLSLGRGKERQPPPAIHYLECVSAADSEGGGRSDARWEGLLKQAFQKRERLQETVN